MDQTIKNAELYLKARLAEGARRPDLHRNINPVYERYLQVLRERPRDYAREAGGMFAVMRAPSFSNRFDVPASSCTDCHYAECHTTYI
ncbi:MAG TPA: hypothetical protein PKN50_03490 [Spirochaetota bacterium]|jgi:hypothetical protein|nr:hypothetical protein [Spirochaetota bacterium]HPV40727.1 hypothetical protein [Spirochaetota bacterium]